MDLSGTHMLERAFAERFRFAVNQHLSDRSDAPPDIEVFWKSPERWMEGWFWKQHERWDDVLVHQYFRVTEGSAIRNLEFESELGSDLFAAASQEPASDSVFTPPSLPRPWHRITRSSADP